MQSRPAIGNGANTKQPSPGPMAPSAPCGTPRPGAGTSSCPLAPVKIMLLRGPKPCPTASIAMTAQPAAAKVEAHRFPGDTMRSLSRPCPTMATGYPPVGLESSGQINVELNLFGASGGRQRRRGGRHRNALGDVQVIGRRVNAKCDAGDTLQQ